MQDLTYPLLITVARLIFFSFKDNNTGLVLQVLEAYHKHKIVKLGMNFAALTMADMTGSVSHLMTSNDDVESYITSIIMSNAMDATLLHSKDQSASAMLRFSSASQFDALQNAYTQRQLVQGLESLNAVNVGDSDHALRVSNDHVRYLQGSQRAQKSVGVSGSGELGIDEDIMDRAMD